MRLSLIGRVVEPVTKLERKSENLAPDASVVVISVAAVVVVPGVLTITLVIAADESLKKRLR